MTKHILNTYIYILFLLCIIVPTIATANGGSVSLQRIYLLGALPEGPKPDNPNHFRFFKLPNVITRLILAFL